MKYPYTRLLASAVTYTIALAVITTNTGCANLATILGLATTIIAGLNIYTSVRAIRTERKQNVSNANR